MACWGHQAVYTGSHSSAARPGECGGGGSHSLTSIVARFIGPPPSMTENAVLESVRACQTVATATTTLTWSCSTRVKPPQVSMTWLLAERPHPLTVYIEGNLNMVNPFTASINLLKLVLAVVFTIGFELQLLWATFWSIGYEYDWHCPLFCWLMPLLTLWLL